MERSDVWITNLQVSTIIKMRRKSMVYISDFRCKSYFPTLSLLSSTNSTSFLLLLVNNFYRNLLFYFHRYLLYLSIDYYSFPTVLMQLHFTLKWKEFIYSEYILVNVCCSNMHLTFSDTNCVYTLKFLQFSLYRIMIYLVWLLIHKMN
jgi:hypothetical protein